MTGKTVLVTGGNSGIGYYDVRSVEILRGGAESTMRDITAEYDNMARKNTFSR